MPFSRTNKSAVVETPIENALQLKRRAVKAAGILFDGRNGREVAQFAREFGGFTARNGGSYVSVHSATGESARVRKGEYLVVDADGSLKKYTEEEFSTYFLPTGKPAGSK